MAASPICFWLHVKIHSLGLLLGGIAESINDSARCYRSVVCPSACPYVTLMNPAKAVGRNEMPFGRDTHVVPNITSY